MSGETVEHTPRQPWDVRRLRLSVVEGPDAGKVQDATEGTLSIGTHPGNALVLTDRTVSRFHSELSLDTGGARIRDLDSRNGTLVDGLEVKEAFLRRDAILEIGATKIRVALAEETTRVALSERTRFGGLVGESRSMRAAFSLLERAAASDATVLLEGETGTGKGLAAEALHRASARGRKPFVVLDCSAIPESLLESELFGHEKGAFTGAESRRVGVFEEASGGTVFLDELGELPERLQPKLLRVIENREIKPVGSSVTRPVDVRLVAATHKDLRAEVNAGRFRADLYYRLAVVRITLPSLRQRPEDVPVLLDSILKRLGADDEQAAALRTPELLAQLRRGSWPGNVRELRNHVERCLVFQDALPLVDAFEADGMDPTPLPVEAATIDVSVPLGDARKTAVDAFEKAYLTELLRVHGGKVTAAARAAGIGRVYLYKLLVKHGMR